MYKKLTQRVISLLLCMVLCLLPVLTFTVDAATVNYVYQGQYVYNWGTREETATFLSPMAEKFYKENKVTYAELAALSGSSNVNAVPNSALYKKLQLLMKSNHTHETNYGETRYQYVYTDCQQSGRWQNGKISSFYSGAPIGPGWDSGATWNREHTWPNSKGDASGNGENDIMMLRPTAKSENGSRGNKAYGKSSGYYNPNMESGGKHDVRGDVARIMLFVYCRWGNTGSMWGSAGVMESKSVLLEWVEADPVDTWELGRNDSTEAITGTRNVFVDYPELIFIMFGEAIPANMPTPSGSALCDHTESVVVGFVAATCSAEGYTGDIRCKACNTKLADGDPISKLEHSFISELEPPSCTEEGYIFNICTVCDFLEEAGPTPALGHNVVEWLTVKEATCTEEGEKQGECSRCGQVETAIIEKTHHYTSVVTAPSCTEKGYTTYTCVCGDSYVADFVDATGEHTYENGVCTGCGESQGTITHKQWTMSLDSVAFLNYYVNLTGFADDVDFAKQGGVVIWTGNVAPTEAKQLQVGLENCKTIEGMIQNDNGWYVRSHEIFAKNLGDMVYMRPYVEVSEGVYVYGPAKGYSPHRYCLDMVGNENERLDTRRLCAALLEYGAAAQLYFDHNEDSLVNEGLNLQEQYNLVYDKSYLNGLNVTDHARSLVSTLDGVKTGVSYKKATLNLQGAIRMSVGYNIDETVIDWTEVEKAEVLFWTEDRIAGIDSLAYELHNYSYSHELRPKNAEDTVELGDYRSISDHIQAKDLGKTMFYCCRIVMKDGSVYRSGLNAYSPEAFLGDHLKTATGEIGDLCKKIAVYGEMARQRFS